VNKAAADVVPVAPVTEEQKDVVLPTLSTPTNGGAPSSSSSCCECVADKKTSSHGKNDHLHPSKVVIPSMWGMTNEQRTGLGEQLKQDAVRAGERGRAGGRGQ